MKPKGLMFKTFLFTTALITLVVLVSFGILYAVLPEYYSFTKTRMLSRNADSLVADLHTLTDTDLIKQRIGQFCRDNNAMTMAFSENGEMLHEISYPLVMLDDAYVGSFSVMIKPEDEGDPQPATEQSMHISVSSNIRVSADEESGFPQHVLRFGQMEGAQNISLERKIDSALIGNIHIIGTLQPINEAQGVVVSLIPYLLVLDILISLAAAYFYSKRLTRPIIRLSETAQSMQFLTPDITSGIMSHDELGSLSQNLDALYARFLTTIESLNDEMRKVSEMEKSKTDFMRAASHELKTPLTALGGIIEGMFDGIGVYADKQRYLGESIKLVGKMTVLVEEILNASKLEYANAEIMPETEVDMSQLTNAVLEDYAFEIAQKQLCVCCKTNGAATVQTDPKLMQITLSNLVSNAVRYTDNGGKIDISVSAACFVIENECAGIPEKDIAHVFEPFFVLDYSRGRRQHGTGLGLFIVKKNLDALGLHYALSNTESGIRFVISFSTKARAQTDRF